MLPLPAVSAMLLPPTMASPEFCAMLPVLDAMLVSPLRLLIAPRNTTLPTEFTCTALVSKPMYSMPIGWSARTLSVIVVLVPVVTVHSW